MNDGRVPEVAVLIPARNEAASIARCLEHVMAQDLDRELLEVIVVDGDSDDGTEEIARATLEGAGFARWVVHRNPGGSTPSNLNAGLALVRAPVVCRVDARSIVPPHYVRTCAEVLSARPEVAVAGGAQVAVARSATARDRGIARALTNRYGMGFSRYRRGARSGPSDTVYLGAFRTDELRHVGGWDERFGTNQDFDLNRRMRARGIIWFEDQLAVEYLPRRSLTDLWRQYQRFGQWKVRYWAITGDRPRPRQVGMAVAPVSALALGLLTVMASRRRVRAAVLMVGLGTASVVAVDSVGGRGPSGSLRVRLCSAVALITVWSGWLTGVWGGVARALAVRLRERHP